MNIHLTLLVLGACLFFMLSQSSAQEITQEAYEKANQENMEFLQRKLDSLNKLYEQFPEKEDSIWQEMQQAQEEFSRRNRATAIKFASLPEGLMHLYWVRSDIEKDALRSILESLPREHRDSPYGKSLHNHIEWAQVEEGGVYQDFTALDAKGNVFRLSEAIQGHSNTFLLYGGLGCVREQGRMILREWCEKLCGNDFQIVVFNACANLEELKELKDIYGLDFTFVSDFNEDHSEMKIRYGAQATPTCYLINQQGEVTLKKIGLPTQEALLSKL